MSPVAPSAALALPLHAGPAPPLLPHWAVLVVATAGLGAVIAAGVALADRLFDLLAV